MDKNPDKEYLSNSSPCGITRNYFPGDSYDTPAGRKRMIDTFLLNCRFCLYSRIVRTVFKANRIAVGGRLNRVTFNELSFDMISNVEDSGGQMHFRGLGNIAKADGPVVLIGNHMSTMETFVTPALILPRKNVGYVVKTSLLTYPVFGPVISNLPNIAVGRVNPREDLVTVLEKGVELLEKGISLMIFPQATRSVEFIPENFNTIGIKLAKRAGVPVVPLALKTDFWGNSRIIKEFGPVHPRKQIWFQFAEPLRITGNGKEQHEWMIEYIKARLKEWNSLEEARQ